MLPVPDKFQKMAMSLMLVLVVISFTFTNVYTLLWTSSNWLISTILPAVIVDLTNEERAEEALPNLRHNSVLDAAATKKAQHMAANEYFAHYSPDNVSPWYWFREVGYNYVHAGENLAIHFSDSDEVVEAWMNSPTHRANIVNGQFVEIGVGTARGTYEGFPTTYVVQLFGTPLAAPERTFPATVEAETEPAVETELVASEVDSTPAAEPEPTSEPASEPTELAQAPMSEATPADNNVLAAESASSASEETVSDEGIDEAELAPATTAAPIASATEDTEASTTTTVGETIPTTTLTMTETTTGDVIFTSSLLTTTTSGTPATIGYVHNNQAPLGWHLLTQPERFLQLLYMGIAGMVFALLLIALVRETRQRHPMQMAYSLGLLLIMAVLWTVQSSLSGGALVI